MPSRPAISLRTSASSSSLSLRNLLASCSMDLSIVTDTASSALSASASRLTGSLISCAHAGSMAAANAIVAIFIVFPASLANTNNACRWEALFGGDIRLLRFRPEDDRVIRQMGGGCGWGGSGGLGGHCVAEIRRFGRTRRLRLRRGNRRGFFGGRKKPRSNLFWNLASGSSKASCFSAGNTQQILALRRSARTSFHWASRSHSTETYCPRACSQENVSVG